MTIKIRCSSCNSALRAPDEYAGRVLSCPKCSNPVTVIDQPSSKPIPTISNGPPSLTSPFANPEQADSMTPELFQELFGSKPTASAPQIIQCPCCLETVRYGAKKCKHCGEILDVDLKRHRDSIGKKRISRTEKKVLIAYLLCFFLGMFGVHRFYVGKNGSGLAILIMTLTVVLIWVSAIWSLLDCIVILTGGFTDENDVRITEWT